MALSRTTRCNTWCVTKALGGLGGNARFQLAGYFLNVNLTLTEPSMTLGPRTVRSARILLRLFL